jgi:hypothetical protein
MHSRHARCAAYLIAFLAAAPALAGNSGADRSWNAPSLTGLSLIGTVPANTSRIGVEIMVSCKAGAIVALDDATGAITATLVAISGPGRDGDQGGVWYDYGHHTGRVRVFSINAACQVSGREW